MPLTTYTVTLETTEYDLATPIDGEWSLKVLTEKGTLKDATTGKVAVAAHKQGTTAGVAVFTLAALPQANLEPADAYYQLTFRPYAKGARAIVTDPFLLDGPKTLDDLTTDSGQPVTPTLIADLTVLRDETVAAAAAAEAVGTTNDTIIAGRIADPASATATELNNAFARHRDLAEQFDLAVPVTAGNAQPVVTIGAATGLVTLDTFAAAWFDVELTGNVLFDVNLSPVAGRNGGRVLVKVYNPDGYTVAFANNTHWIGTPVYGVHALYEMRTFDAGATWYVQENANIPPWTVTRLPGIHLWLKADSLALNDGDPIEVWDDLSGGGRAVSQPDPAKQPVLRYNHLNGRAGVEFAGGQCLSTLNFPSDISSPFSMAAVATPDFVSGTKHVLDGGFMRMSDAAKAWRFGGSSTYLQTAAEAAQGDVPYIVTGLMNGTTSSLRVNGTEAAAGALLEAQTMRSITIGANQAELANYWIGWQYEIIVCDALWDADDLAAVESYLSDKYGIPLP